MLNKHASQRLLLKRTVFVCVTQSMQQVLNKGSLHFTKPKAEETCHFSSLGKMQDSKPLLTYADFTLRVSCPASRVSTARQAQCWHHILLLKDTVLSTFSCQVLAVGVLRLRTARRSKARKADATFYLSALIGPALQAWNSPFGVGKARRCLT